MFSNLESFLLISGISGFSFLAIEQIQKPGNHGKFNTLISLGTKTIYLILSTFLGNLCIQGTPLNLFLKVMNEHLLLLLESGFSGY